MPWRRCTGFQVGLLNDDSSAVIRVLLRSRAILARSARWPSHLMAGSLPLDQLTRRSGSGIRPPGPRGPSWKAIRDRYSRRHFHRMAGSLPLDQLMGRSGSRTQPLGPRNTCWRATQTRFAQWPSHRIAGSLPLGHMTRRSGCGISILRNVFNDSSVNILRENCYLTWMSQAWRQMEKNLYSVFILSITSNPTFTPIVVFIRQNSTLSDLKFS